MSAAAGRLSTELVCAYGQADADAETLAVAESANARRLLQEISLLAPTRRPVLLCGETGTGKTHFARLLHAHSPSAALPLRVVNCAALPESLFASFLGELYEETERMQTSAVSRAVLLDEVGELSPWGQAVLLRRLQLETATGPGPRFIAATHRDLPAMARTGAFSRELLGKLSVARVVLPPLRERRSEIVPLAMHFLRLQMRATGRAFVQVRPALLDSLAQHDWPGNARELRNAMLRTLAANEDGELDVGELPESVRRTSATRTLGTSG